MVYEIIYDYTDETGEEIRDLVEEFEGDWEELQDTIRVIKANGGYNIEACAYEEEEEE